MDKSEPNLLNPAAIIRSIRKQQLQVPHPLPRSVEAPVPNEWDDAACRLWHPAAQAAAKGKLLPPADGEVALKHSDLDALDKACAALQVWCWVRGMPPLDRIISHPRVQGPLREVADYDVFFEAMGQDVHHEKFVLAYPWAKVKEPAPRDVAWARELMRSHQPLLRRFRFLDLELDLLEEDAARGRRRPVPSGQTTWETVKAAQQECLAELRVLGVSLPDVRPPGKAPYPPPPPRETSWRH